MRAAPLVSVDRSWQATVDLDPRISLSQASATITIVDNEPTHPDDPEPDTDSLGPETVIEIPLGNPDGPFLVHVVFTEPVTGFTRDDLRLGHSDRGARITHWFVDPDGMLYTATIGRGKEGEHVWFNVSEGAVQDAAGNPAAFAESKSLYMADTLVAPDTTPPDVVITTEGLPTREFRVDCTWDEPVTEFVKDVVFFGGPAKVS